MAGSGCWRGCEALSIFVGGVCIACTLPIAEVDGDRLTPCGGGEGRVEAAGGIRDFGVT